MSNLSQEIHNFISLQVRLGFLDATEIVFSTIDLFSDETPDLDEIEIINIVHGQLENHKLEEKTWYELTDCDRLDNAFNELNSIGIISRQNFSCCGSCGSLEIVSEMDKYPHAIGYCFYHQQDTERAVFYSDMCLSYGSHNFQEDSAIEIGHRIQQVLNTHGLKTVWNGELKYRIQIVDIDWKRRRN